MVRNFKGVVKVSEVQEEFDNLVNTINNAIDVYNNSLGIEDTDYNNGSSELAPLGYTLSIGGLKTVLDAYNGAVLGCQVLRTDTSNTYLVSEGLLIKDRTIYRLPTQTVTGTGTILYYDTVNDIYTFTSGENTIKICKLNTNRISRLCNTQEFLNESIPNYVMTIPDKNAGWTDEVEDNSEKGQFVGGVAGCNYQSYLFNNLVTYHIYTGDSQDSYWEPFNYLFLPKGISNPYSTPTVTRGTGIRARKVFDYKLERPDYET